MNSMFSKTCFAKAESIFFFFLTAAGQEKTSCWKQAGNRFCSPAKILYKELTEEEI